MMDLSAKGIREYLESLKEPDYGKFSAGLIPGADNILGVRIPKLRAYAKEIAKADYAQFFLNARYDTFEEIVLRSFVIGYIKTDIEYVLEQVRDFMPYNNNWSINDGLCSTLKITLKNRERVLEFLQPYINSEIEFENRFASIMLMDYYLTDEYIDMVLNVYSHFEHEGYYARMGAAWGVATAYAKFPEKTQHFMESWRVDDWTYNKSIQKMKESYRIDKDTKIRLNEMKRKA